MTESITVKSSDWVNQYFSPKNGEYRQCLFNLSATGGGPNRDQPICCTDTLKSSTSTGNLAKHLYSKHVKQQHGDFRGLLNGIHEHYPRIAVEQHSRLVPTYKRQREDSTQQSLRDSVRLQSNADLPVVLARCFASCSLPHHLVDNPDFVALLDAYRAADIRLPCRQSIAPMIAKQREKLYISLVQRLRQQSVQSPVTLAFDGWTNVRRTKVINVILLCKGAAYYWRSRVSLGGRGEATVLAKQLEDDLNTLISEGIIVSAVIGDNESVNKSTFGILKHQYPSLVYVPCASHTLQLCIRRAFRSNPTAAAVRSTTKRIVNQITRSKQLRTKLRTIQESAVESGTRKHVLILIRPNATRWSSDYHAFERMASLKAVIQFIASEVESFKVPDSYWQDVQALSTFLKPFTVATNIIQSDCAGLVDVFVQFDLLQRHCSDVIDANESTAGIAGAMRDAILHYWNKHIHQKAVLASVQLSVSTTRIRQSDLFTSSARRNWWRWLERWSATYLAANHRRLNECKHKSIPDAIDAFKSQLALFIDQQHPFTNIEDDIVYQSARPSNDPLFFTYNAREYWLKNVSIVPELSYVALALLSINCSEASVERSFSAQSTTHSLKRNRLHDKKIEDEMFVKLNARALNNASIRQPLIHLSRDADENDSEASDQSDSEPESDDDSDYDENDDDDLDTVMYSSDDEVIDSDDDIIAQRHSHSNRSIDDCDTTSSGELQWMDPQSVSLSRPQLPSPLNSHSSQSFTSSNHPVRHNWSYRPSVTASYTQFCQTFINEHRLSGQPWKQRGITDKLETAMRSHSVMRKEQLSHVKRHIAWMLTTDTSAHIDVSDTQNCT